MASEETREGLATAVETVMAEGDGSPPAGGEQLPLLPGTGPEAEPGSNGPPSDAPRGAGRPPGARNKRTEEWIAYLRHKGYSKPPLEVLAELYSATEAELVKDHKVKPEDAAKLRRDCAVAAAPYWHQKQPMAVSVDAKGVVYLSFNMPSEEELDAQDGEGSGYDLEARVIGLEDVGKSEG